MARSPGKDALALKVFHERVCFGDREQVKAATPYTEGLIPDLWALTETGMNFGTPGEVRDWHMHISQSGVDQLLGGHLCAMAVHIKRTEDPANPLRDKLITDPVPSKFVVFLALFYVIDQVQSLDVQSTVRNSDAIVAKLESMRDCDMGSLKIQGMLNLILRFIVSPHRTIGRELFTGLRCLLNAAELESAAFFPEMTAGQAFCYFVVGVATVGTVGNLDKFCLNVLKPL